jgi:hypothetical protein
VGGSHIVSLRTMLVYLTNCVVISSILALFLHGSPLIYAQENEQFLTHQDANRKFTIQYPGNWEKKENQSGGVSFYIPESSAIFSIYVQSLVQLEELFHEQYVVSEKAIFNLSGL